MRHLYLSELIRFRRLAALGTIFREHGITGLATFAWDDYFPAGTVEHTGYLDSTAVLAHGLAAAPAARRDHLLRQVELADVFAVPGPRVARFPTRHQLMFADRYLVLDEKDGDVRWTFSHDDMAFHGRAGRSGEPAGWLGRRGRVAAGSHPGRSPTAIASPPSPTCSATAT